MWVSQGKRDISEPFQFHSSRGVVMTCSCDEPAVFHRSGDSLWMESDWHEQRVGGQVGHVEGIPT